MTQVTVNVKTPRQVDRIRATTVGQVYELSLTKGYVSRWGLPQAVRELIQNALDSDSPFRYEWKYDPAEEPTGPWTLSLISEFTTLTPQTLLLGTTSKSESEDAIGSFGEGYKIALLVLTRLGYDVDMLNGEVLWRPIFRYNRKFGDELLVVEESFLADKTNKGLTVKVYGLSQEERESIESSCLLMQDKVGEVKQTEYGDILLEQPAKLYVGNLYVCDTELQFGYNIKPKYVKLERDRQTVNDWDLKDIVGKMWLATGETSRVAQMILEEVPDVYTVGYGAPELVREECYKLFREKHPTALIASSPEDARKKIAEGMTTTIYAGGGVYYAVSESPSYRREVSTPQVRVDTPQDILRAFRSAWSKHLSETALKAFDELVNQAKNWRSY